MEQIYLTAEELPARISHGAERGRAAAAEELDDE